MAFREQEISKEVQELEDSSYEELKQCRFCDHSENPQNPRFFWGSNQVEDVNDIPCCDLEKGEELLGSAKRLVHDMDTTYSTILRLTNATKCGRKSLNRILGGVVSEENEFPWQCALLKKDNSFFGCGAVLLSCDPLIIATAAHCFVE